MERKASEQALHESERRQFEQRQFLETLLNEARACIAVLTGTDLRYTMVNPSYQALRPDVPMIGRRYRDVFPPEIAPGTEAAMRRVIETGELHEDHGYDVPLPGKPDASWDRQLVRLPPREGEEASVLLIAWDTTDRKRAQRHLATTQERLETALSAGNVATWVWNIVENKIMADSNLAAFFGVSESEAQGGPLAVYLDAIHPDDRARVANDIQAALDSQSPQYHSEYRIARGTEDVRWVLARGTIERNDNGAPLRMTGVLLDVTERKRTEQELQFSLVRSEAIFNQMTEGLVIFDPDGNFLDMNPAALAIHGFDNVDILKRHLHALTEVFELYDLNDNLLPTEAWPIGRALSGEKFSSYEVQVRRPDIGKAWIASYGGTPVYDAEGRLLLSIVTLRDVTDHRRAEEELKLLNETLERRVAERTAKVQAQADQLRALSYQLAHAEQRERKQLATVLHDHIQQLIVVAQMQVEAIRHDARSVDLQAQLQKTESILQETLMASRSLALDLSPPILREAGFIEALKWLAARMEKQQQFHVHLRIDGKAEPTDEETRFLLFECLRELLFNSVKHSGVNKADVVVLQLDEQTMKIVVSDLGRGFDPERMIAQRTKEASFGLFSIQERLAYIGGRMKIESAPGRGTKVTVTVPRGRVLQRQGAPPATTTAAADITDTVRIQSKFDLCRVMIVDDHKIMREGLAGILQFEADMEVVGEAADGPQAIELARELKPDVIIMDVNLGEMSGIEVTRNILAAQPATRIIGLSMHLDESIGDAMLKAGAKIYLTKGGPAQDLVEAIRKCA